MLSTGITLDTELFSYSIQGVLYVNYTVSGCNFRGEYQISLVKNTLLSAAHWFDSKGFTYY